MGQLELQTPKFSATWLFVLTCLQTHIVKIYISTHIHWCIWQLKLVYHRFMLTFTDTLQKLVVQALGCTITVNT